jgi:hypothetical protein
MATSLNLFDNGAVGAKLGDALPTWTRKLGLSFGKGVMLSVQNLVFTSLDNV